MNIFWNGPLVLLSVSAAMLLKELVIRFVGDGIALCVFFIPLYLTKDTIEVVTTERHIQHTAVVKR